MVDDGSSDDSASDGNRPGEVNSEVALDDELQAMVDDESSDDSARDGNAFEEYSEEEFDNELQALLRERWYSGGHRIEVKSEDEPDEYFQDHDESSEDVLDYDSTDD